jgi:5-methyltetrahydrofolate--homocysteine methyltransferase
MNFTEEDWQRVERDTSAWWAGELDRPLVYLAVTNPVPLNDPGAPLYSYWSNYPLDMPADEIVNRFEPVLAGTHFYGDAFPWWWLNFGPGIVAGFLGARVHSVYQPAETVWFSPPGKMQLAELEFKYDPDNIWWRRVKELTGALAERYGRNLVVSHTDLGGNLDILASFRGTQELLFDLVDCPQEVDRLTRDITRLLLRY